MSQAYTWQNFTNLKTGESFERRIFYTIIALVFTLGIYIINWAVSWKAGGYLTTIGAVLGFFLHFFGFYALWNRNVRTLTLYLVFLSIISLLYIANIVISSLSLVLNNYTYDSNEVTDVTFVLSGIAGNENTLGFLYVFIIVINVILVFLTWFLCYNVFNIRRELLSQNKNLIENPDVSYQSNNKALIDYNIPGFQTISSQHSSQSSSRASQLSTPAMLMKKTKPTILNDDKVENEKDSEEDKNDADSL